MLELSADLHSLFSEYIIQMLKKNDITTVQEFLKTETNKLARVACFDLVNIIRLKKDLVELIGIGPINGLVHYEILVNQSSYIPTGIQSLDVLLNGGFLSGNLIDLCGLASSGKTQLHTTIAIHWAKNHDYETFVIDTKGDFSGERINRILLSQGLTDADSRKKILRSIRVERCNDSLELIDLVKVLLNQIGSFPKLKFLVIDSLPSLWFLFHGNNLLAQIEHNIIVLTVNIVTRWISSGNYICVCFFCVSQLYSN